MTGGSEWRGICPNCSGDIGKLIWPALDTICPHCAALFTAEHGISQLIKKQHLQHYETFLNDYTTIRHAEGRGSTSADYYLSLPEPTVSDPLAWQWTIRNISYQYLYSKFLSSTDRTLKVVDVGAGVGWLSNRLATLGHKPVAIDLSVDQLDGLAASSHYNGTWPRIQAEFDHLPLADSQADLIIYNASLHYSTDYRKTLHEAQRVLKNDGQIVIMDSPVYNLVSSGEQMKAERHILFEKEYGFRSDSINSIEYLTWDRLDELGSALGLRWKTLKPWYGWRWALRPLSARLMRKREPSRFALLIGSITNGASS